jgi:hypothetical protein
MRIVNASTQNRRTGIYFAFLFPWFIAPSKLRQPRPAPPSLGLCNVVYLWPDPRLCIQYIEGAYSPHLPPLDLTPQFLQFTNDDLERALDLTTTGEG